MPRQQFTSPPCRISRLLLLIALVLATTSPTTSHASDEIRYSTAIAPLLRTYCSACHNRTEANGGLSVLSPDELLKGSEDGPVISLDSPDSSRLLAVIASTGEDHMPPADQPQPTPAEQELLRQWIRAGTKFDSRMALLPSLPAVKPRTSRPPVPTSLDINSDGTRLLLGKFRSVEILPFTTSPPAPASTPTLTSLTIPDGKVTDVHFSRDGSRILVAAGTPGLAGRAVIATAADPTVLAEFSGATDILYSATWSPDESLVATAGYDRIIRLYQASSGQLIREITGHNGAIFDLAFSPDGTLLASASADATVKIWQTATGERFDTLSQPLSEQSSLAFHPDGNSVYAVGADSRIRQWKLVSRSKPDINPLLVSRFAHEGAVSLLRISRDGQLLATASDTGSVKLWHAASVTELAAHSFPDDAAVCLQFTPWHSLLLMTRSGARHLLPLPDSNTAAATIARTSTATSIPIPVVATANAAAPPASITEAEPNTALSAAQQVPFPAEISGVLHDPATAQPDADLFRFPALKGQPVLIEVLASRNKSPVDSRVEILTPDGQPVLHMNLQAVRDSWFTFRGKDSDTSDDFRMFNWQEMELNEYLYADGEVVRLWLYPRGPDSGFKVYPGFGQRHTWFNTTPVTHPLQGPAFIVV
ncbi:MAG: c-type cytochrome domain-containing protein, partial [Planctomycetota bacterium]